MNPEIGKVLMSEVRRTSCSKKVNNNRNKIIGAAGI
jgi:hypothetical protein